MTPSQNGTSYLHVATIYTDYFTKAVLINLFMGLIIK